MVTNLRLTFRLILSLAAKQPAFARGVVAPGEVSEEPGEVLA